eukprot:TRINITY_DN93952_c0_g1_i1.p1 TRINITY_DN93952_c0_g1~~TRINITY_DN93952_c0_g1_i1.p1  ORF type:complete len:277 (+),score=43.23 TRINITY_DN93952_c0_g1_i1:49-879(+)
MALSSEDDSWSAIFWDIVAGGRNCCSRSRNIGSAEDAKQAALTGRPPARPAKPRGRTGLSWLEESDGMQQRHSSTEQRNSTQGYAQVPHDFGPTFGNLPAFSGDDPYQQGSVPQGLSSARSSISRATLSRSQADKLWQEAPAAPAASQAAAVGDSLPQPEAQLPDEWHWPSWCLNFRCATVEVWVFDDETHAGRWLPAQPQSKVVDHSGRDRYLCAEYKWDQDFYVQDFEPKHVRCRDTKKTALEEITQLARFSVGQSTKVVDRIALDRTKMMIRG